MLIWNPSCEHDCTATTTTSEMAGSLLITESGDYLITEDGLFIEVE